MRVGRRVLSGVVVAAVVALGAVAGCGGKSSSDEVVLVTHSSFVVSDGVRREFEESSGKKLTILQTGDAGEALTRALLTAGNPEGDVFFGVDSNLLSRALDGDLFEPYEPAGLEHVDVRYALDPEHRVTPIDHGEVCLNYDRAWFEDRGIAPPEFLEQLTEPRYRGLLVAQNPATSSPGLAFMLATIALFGEEGWKGFWADLRRNDVLVTSGWEEAYNARFSGSSSGGGDRPIVVSYATSPPAEVIFRKPRPTEAPTAVLTDSCFRQIEFAGVLRGTSNEQGAEELIDFMLTRRFQEDVPLSMFVFPVDSEAELPPEFSKYAVVPESPLELPPEAIEVNRDRWIKEWTATVLR